MSEREQVWRERIEWQPWSGLTVAKCCEEAGVSVASFYRWKKLLTEPQGPRRLRSTRRTEVRASGPKKRASQFVPIALRDSSTSPSPPQSIASNRGCSMRKSFDGLFGIVREEFRQDPLSGHLFLFVNKRRDRMKAIFWDDDGFVIWYKRLEVGTWQLPGSASTTLELEAHEIQLRADHLSETGPLSISWKERARNRTGLRRCVGIRKTAALPAATSQTLSRTLEPRKMEAVFLHGKPLPVRVALKTSRGGLFSSSR